MLRRIASGLAFLSVVLIAVSWMARQDAVIVDLFLSAAGWWFLSRVA